MVLILQPTSSPFAGTLRYSWIDRNGVLRDLSGQSSDIYVSATNGGPQGLGAAPVQINDEKLPWAPGSAVRQQQVMPCRPQIPIDVMKTSPGALMAALDDLRDWFYTGDERNRLPGYFRVTREDESIRQWLCYYAGGLEGNYANGGPDWASYVVDLFAPDSYPTDEADRTQTWSIADFPWNGSAFVGSVSALNGGQLDAYPVWQITGPAQGIAIFNTTPGNGRSWGWGGTVAAGQVLTVDTRPASAGRFTFPVYVFAGVSAAQYRTVNSDLWWLGPGTNSILISIGALADSNTRVQLSYRQRFRGGLR